MSDHDKSLIDQVKDALGMGNNRDDETHQDPIDVEHGGGGDLRRDEGEPIGGVGGATQATGRLGASGGTGASAALGGAGAGGPIGDDPHTSTGEGGSAAPAGGVRTEYEMGEEVDPDHERVAESGVMAERRGDADVDTWRNQDHPGSASTRGEAASGESPFDESDERP